MIKTEVKKSTLTKDVKFNITLKGYNHKYTKGLVGDIVYTATLETPDKDEKEDGLTERVVRKMAYVLKDGTEFAYVTKRSDKEGIQEENIEVRLSDVKAYESVLDMLERYI